MWRRQRRKKTLKKNVTHRDHEEGNELEERDWQKESDKIKDHPEAKSRVLDKGANKETGGGKGHQKRDKKRGKSAPPGAGGV